MQDAYSAPTLTLLEIAAENGYATSFPEGGVGGMSLMANYDAFYDQFETTDDITEEY